MLKLRLVSGVALVTAIGLTVFWEHPAAVAIFVTLAACALAGCLWEYFGMTARLQARGYPLLTIAAALALLAHAATAGGATVAWRVGGESIVLFLFICAAAILTLRQYPGRGKAALADLAVSACGLLCLAWPIVFLAKIYFLVPAGSNAPYLFIWLALVTKCGDIGGYFAGTLTARRASGNHKLAPALSPKKSWEGLVGGIVLSAGVACWLCAAFGDRLLVNGAPVLSTASAIGLAVVLTVIGLAGDLSESALKRASDVKDSGAIIPGMGGVMDVLDSLVFAGPIFYCYLLIVG
jgi:phosphatidate cytidylyltransferase